MNFSFEKQTEDCTMCEEPVDDKWCVLLDCGHQGHKKCLNRWTGHSRVLHYKEQPEVVIDHVDTNAGTCPMCRMEFGTDDLMMWSDYEKAKKKHLKKIKREKKIEKSK